MNELIKTIEVKSLMSYSNNFLHKGGIHIIINNSMLCKKIHIEDFLDNKDFEIVINKLDSVNCNRCKKIFRKLKMN